MNDTNMEEIDKMRLEIDSIKREKNDLKNEIIKYERFMSSIMIELGG